REIWKPGRRGQALHGARARADRDDAALETGRAQVRDHGPADLERIARRPDHRHAAGVEERGERSAHARGPSTIASSASKASGTVKMPTTRSPSHTGRAPIRCS